MKNLGYSLILSSFLFLWIPIAMILDTLYWWVQMETSNEEVLRSSQIIDFGGSPVSLIVIFGIGISLFSIGIYKVNCYLKDKIENK